MPKVINIPNAGINSAARTEPCSLPDLVLYILKPGPSSRRVRDLKAFGMRGSDKASPLAIIRQGFPILKDYDVKNLKLSIYAKDPCGGSAHWIRIMDGALEYVLQHVTVQAISVKPTVKLD